MQTISIFLTKIVPKTVNNNWVVLENLYFQNCTTTFTPDFLKVKTRSTFVLPKRRARIWSFNLKRFED